MSNEVWMAPEKAIAHVASPTGETAQIRPIDPEFWDRQGNIEFYQYVREHEQYLKKQREADEIVYHYTTLHALHGIVTDGSIWASDVRQLNDRFELKYALEGMRSVVAQDWEHGVNRQPLDAIFRSGRTWQFVTCLSYSRDQLSQWRAYGNRIGVAIAFDRKHLVCAANSQSGDVVACRYFKPHEFGALQADLKPIVEAIRDPKVLNKEGALIDVTLQDELTQRVVQIATSIKHHSFIEERECRLVFSKKSIADAIQFRSSQSALTPYIKIDIDGRRIGMLQRRRYSNHLGMMEILVWPNNVDDEVLDSVDMLLGNAGHVLISRSESPYRT